MDKKELAVQALNQIDELERILDKTIDKQSTDIIGLDETDKTLKKFKIIRQVNLFDVLTENKKLLRLVKENMQYFKDNLS